MRNIDTRERLCQSPVSLKLRRARMKWFGHVNKTGGERQLRRIMNAEMEEKKVGQPRTRWKDMIRRVLESRCLSVEQAAPEAQDRKRWTSIVPALCNYNVAGS